MMGTPLHRKLALARLLVTLTEQVVALPSSDEDDRLPQSSWSYWPFVSARPRSLLAGLSIGNEPLAQSDIPEGNWNHADWPKFSFGYLQIQGGRSSQGEELHKAKKNKLSRPEPDTFLGDLPHQQLDRLSAINAVKYDADKKTLLVLPARGSWICAGSTRSARPTRRSIRRVPV